MDDTEQDNWLTSVYKKIKAFPYAGIVLAFLSTCSFTVTHVTASMLSDFNAVEPMLVTGIMQCILLMPICCVKKYRLTGARHERIVLLARSVSGFVTIFAVFASYHLLPMGDASTIAFCSPVFTYILAWILMREECGIFQFVLVPVVIAGITLVSRPAFLFGGQEEVEAYNRILGSILAFIACLAGAGIFISVRFLHQTPVILILTEMSVAWILLSSFCILIFIYVPGIGFMAEGMILPTSLKDIGLMILNATATIVGQGLMVFALQLEEAGLVAVVRSTSIVTNYLAQMIFLPDQEINLISIGGALLIFGCVTIAGIRKWLNNQGAGKWAVVWTLLNCKSVDNRQSEQEESHQ